MYGEQQLQKSLWNKQTESLKNLGTKTFPGKSMPNKLTQGGEKPRVQPAVGKGYK